MNKRSRRWGEWISAIVVTAIALACSGWVAPVGAQPSGPPKGPPKILFFILDDVGIDQMQAFGYGGVTAPRLPTINAIANAGVRFRNFWTMPECSPSRALFFEGRYPLRTNVLDAILSADLANSQVSPYETTIPKVLKPLGYQNGLFGKFHLSGSNVNATAAANNPLGYTNVYQLGWDYFAGWQDGAPHPIDVTAGGIAATNVSYACGFVPSKAQDPHGADNGACYFVNQSCQEMTIAQAPTPGRACLEQGGIFDPGAACKSTAPANVDFSLQNGYYVGELVINAQYGLSKVIKAADPSGFGRGYRSIIESDRAIEWIKRQPATTPWMATVSYSSAHAPYQQPPTKLLPAGSTPTGGFDCVASEADQRVLSNQMIESMDAEIGRVLTETGVASRNPDGTLNYDPASSNTMIVIVGDNGTYGPGVKAPFNPERAKGTVYQTGVWTPLIVAGPLVNAPGREVGAMVNAADVFQLFGEMAGVDVHTVVPKSRPLDSVSVLPYLLDPNQRSLRTTNFTQTASNLKPVGYVVPPCVIASLNTCVQIFPSQQLCALEGGTWWGAADGSNPPLPIGSGAPQPDCCSVNKYLAANSQTPYSVLADWQMAMRDDNYKLVNAATTDWDATAGKCATTLKTEFYAIDENVPPKLDNKDDNLLVPPHVLTDPQKIALSNLSNQLARLLASQVPCPGDGNLDGVVDQADIDQFNIWANTTHGGGKSSWYDFNLDGLTNPLDVPYITQGQFPRNCPTSTAG